MLEIKSLPPLLSVEQGAEFLGANPRTVQRMCERGVLVACRAGNRWRLNRDFLLRFAGYKTQSTAAGAN